MQTTGNLGLKKPEGTDIVDIADLNGNMDILDNAVTGKVDKITGKQLSTNDYTAAEKTKLAGIATGANNYVHPNHTGDVISTGDGVTAIAAGVIVNADVNAAAGIDASKIGNGAVSNAEFGYLDGVTSGIQGQLNGKAPLVTTPQQTTADITFYVRTDGNDNNTGLSNTAGGAFKNINKALSMLPTIINHGVVINVAAGTYAESVVIAKKRGSGYIVIQGATGGVADSVNYVVTNMRVAFCDIVVGIKGFTYTDVNAPAVAGEFSSKQIQFDDCRIVAPSSFGGFYANSCPAFIVANCMISNRARAFDSSSHSQMFVQNNTGTGNNIVFYTYAAEIRRGGVNPTGSIPTFIENGGVITSDAGVVNPWGDNTAATRSFIRATAGISLQSISSTVWTKVLYPLENLDHLGEYDPSLSRFVARQPGNYQINACAGLTNGNTAGELFLYVNGSSYRRFDYAFVPASYSYTLKGSACIELNVGDYLEVYARSSIANTLSTGWDSSFEVIRIA